MSIQFALPKINKSLTRKPCDYYSENFPLSLKSLSDIRIHSDITKKTYTETLHRHYYQFICSTKERNIHNSLRHSKHFIALTSYLFTWKGENKHLVRELNFRELVRLWFKVCFFKADEELGRGYFHNKYPQVQQIISEGAISCWEKYWEQNANSVRHLPKKSLKEKTRNYSLHKTERKIFGYTLEEIEQELNHPALEDDKMEELLDLKKKIEAYRKNIQNRDSEIKEKKKLNAQINLAMQKTLNSIWGMKKCKEYFCGHPDVSAEQAGKALQYPAEVVELWKEMEFNPELLSSQGNGRRIK